MTKEKKIEKLQQFINDQAKVLARQEELIKKQHARIIKDNSAKVGEQILDALFGNTGNIIELVNTIMGKNTIIPIDKIRETPIEKPKEGETPIEKPKEVFITEFLRNEIWLTSCLTNEEFSKLLGTNMFYIGTICNIAHYYDKTQDCTIYRQRSVPQ